MAEQKQENWARVFTTSNGKQVLFTVLYEPNEEEYIVMAQFKHDEMGAHAELKVFFDEEEHAQKMFDERATQEYAETLAVTGDLRSWM